VRDRLRDRDPYVQRDRDRERDQEIQLPKK